MGQTPFHIRPPPPPPGTKKPCLRPPPPVAISSLLFGCFSRGTRRRRRSRKFKIQIRPLLFFSLSVGESFLGGEEMAAAEAEAAGWSVRPSEVERLMNGIRRPQQYI